MVDTYGFGGSEPATSVAATPGESAQSVQTGTGSTAEAVDSTIRDTMQNDVQRGQSSVDGMGLTPTWDASVTGDEVSYVGNTAAQCGPGANSNIGSWPVRSGSYDPHSGGPGANVWSQVLPDRGSAIPKVKNDE